MSTLLRIANLAIKGSTGNAKPYDWLKIDAMGNGNHRLDFDDFKIIGNNLIKECGLEDAVERISTVATTLIDDAGEVLSEAGDAVLSFLDAIP